MPVSLTPEQRTPVNHSGSSVVLASGAGCGKTSVLTARYLHLLASGLRPSAIAAITFTDRAARQMRGRIRRDVAAQLAQTIPGTEPHQRWRQHLRDLETAPINTIHGFCGSLLRQHATQAGLDPRFEILTGALAATLRTESLRSRLHQLLTDPAPLGEDLRELVVLFGWTAVREAIDDLVLNPDPPAWAAWLAKSPADLAREWRDDHRRDLLAAFRTHLFNDVPKLTSALAAVRAANPPTPEGRDTRAAILTAIDQLPDRLEELIQLARVGRTGTKVWGEADYPAIRDAFTVLREKLKKEFAPFEAEPVKLEEAAIVGQRFLRVATAVNDAYRDRKRRDARADFHDLLSLARDLLRDHPTIRTALRKRFQALLLDELQDTDPLQMEVVELLVGEGLRDGKLFAVGDAKQSIYRFRGAEVELFRRLRDTVPAAGRLDLTRNFRSQRGVLDFVNALCRTWFEGEKPLEHQYENIPGLHHVEFLWSMPGGVHEEGEERESVAEIRAREADAIARRIVELLKDLTPRIHSPDHPPRTVLPGDIVLLFRSMTQVAIYESALRRHGLDYYLVGGRAFFAQQEVYDLVNVLSAIENPQDNLALAGTLRSPFCNLSDDALHLIATHGDGVWAGLFADDRFARLPADQQPTVARARRFLAAWREQKDRLPIARLLDRLFADSGYDAATQFEFLGDRKLANLWKLIDLAREFDQAGFGLPEFIAHLTDQVARQPREEQAATSPEEGPDVIRIMSIHQAKGLEYPVVILPDLAAEVRGGVYQTARWHRKLGCLVRLPNDVLDSERKEGNVPFSELPKELGEIADKIADAAESRRLIYVACTRARDLLILSAGLPAPFPPERPTQPPAKSKGPWLHNLANRFDLQTGHCHDDDEPTRATVRIDTGERPE